MSPQERTQVADPVAGPDAAHADVAPPATQPVEPDLAARLDRLAKLHRQGVLDDDEFDAAKGLLLQRPGLRAPLARAHTRHVLPEVHPVDTALTITAVVLEIVAGRLERHVSERRKHREASRSNMA